MISAIVVVAGIAVAASMLQSRPESIELFAAAMPSLNELHDTAGVNQLPVQEVEDQSLMYPGDIKQ